MRRLPLAGALLAAAGAGAIVARRRGGGRERVSLRFDDGSSLALDRSSPEAARVLAAARRALAPSP